MKKWIWVPSLLALSVLGALSPIQAQTPDLACRVELELPERVAEITPDFDGPLFSRTFQARLVKLTQSFASCRFRLVVQFRGNSAQSLRGEFLNPSGDAIGFRVYVDPMLGVFAKDRFQARDSEKLEAEISNNTRDSSQVLNFDIIVDKQLSPPAGIYQSELIIQVLNHETGLLVDQKSLQLIYHQPNQAQIVQTQEKKTAQLLSNGVQVLQVIHLRKKSDGEFNEDLIKTQYLKPRQNVNIPEASAGVQELRLVNPL